MSTSTPPGFVPPPPDPSNPPDPSLIEQAQGLEQTPPEVLDIPAVFVNGFYITVSRGLVRIAFSEMSEDLPPRYRTAVLLPAADALSLADWLVMLSREQPEQPTEPSLPEERTEN